MAADHFVDDFEGSDQEDYGNKNYYYPKPLPLFNLDSIEDETGFTTSEKIALKNAWRIIKLNFKRHSSDIFLDFFTEHEYLTDRFRFKGKIHMKSLHEHPKSVLSIYGRIIEDGLENLAALNAILTEVAMGHKQLNVKASEVGLLSYAVKDHLLVALRNIKSPTLIVGMEKVCDAITNFHDEMLRQPQHTDSDLDLTTTQPATQDE